MHNIFSCEITLTIGKSHFIAYAARPNGAVLRKSPNVNVKFKAETIADTKPTENVEPTIRKNFPESWLFDNFETKGNDTDEYVYNLKHHIFLCVYVLKPFIQLIRMFFG